MFNHLDPSIQHITRSKLTSYFTPKKLNKAETIIPSLLDDVSCVVISYDLSMSKTTQDIFSMTEYYTREHVRDHDHIGILITPSTYGESFAGLLGNVINQFNLGSKLVGITSVEGTNLARCEAILQSNFDSTGLFDLVNPLFLMQ